MPANPPTPSLPRAAALIVAWMGVSIAAFVTLDRLGVDRMHPTAEPGWLALGLLVTSTLGVGGIVAWGSVRALGRTWAEAGWDLRRPGLSVRDGVLGGLLGVGLVVLLARIAGSSAREIVDTLTAPSLTDRAFFVWIGVQAAVVEETLFRGNLFGGLRARLGPSLALVTQALVFAAYHLQPHPIALLGKTCTGLLLGALLLRRGTLLAPAIAHALIWSLAGML